VNPLGTPLRSVTDGGGVLCDPRLSVVLGQEAREGTSGGALDFFRNMAVNNSVVPSAHLDGSRTYKASSPDEEALVKAAASFNVTMMSREGPV
jgi:magnesium-transporting ATPase (P-type)